MTITLAFDVYGTLINTSGVMIFSNNILMTKQNSLWNYGVRSSLSILFAEA